MDPAKNLKLDLEDIPKFCPQCNIIGIKSKVKKYRIKEQKSKVVMCESENCPWPLSFNTMEEVRIEEKPTCNSCGISFSKESNLNRHLSRKSCTKNLKKETVSADEGNLASFLRQNHEYADLVNSVCGCDYLR